MFKMSLWRTQAVEWVSQQFDSTGMSYTHRVGEQVFHPLLMALLLPPWGVRQFGGLGPFGHHNGELCVCVCVYTCVFACGVCDRFCHQ